jgi:Cu-Zn family superoxide dismutase
MNMLKNGLVAVFFFLWIALVTVGGQSAQRGSGGAMADLKPTQGNTAQGMVTFEPSSGKVHVVAKLTGLKPGKHGFHIHEKGDCSAPDASSAGAHFNPTMKNHGAPDAPEHHAGDLGNVEANANGEATLDKTVDFLTLGSGPDSIVGKAVVLHGQEDDLKSQPAGNAGPRIACGVVQTK